MDMNYNTKLLIAIEGFLRNASNIDAPFMVKGSIVTRQFFKNPNIRHVQDLDWVYLERIDELELAGGIFSDWVIKITESNEDERVWFRSFKDNNFWRMIEYAMDDDFPTTNTDLYCIIDDKEEVDPLGLDISFNLDIDFPPEEIIYKPLLGTSFKLEKVCPYCLQVSWKLHQLLVRPRLKDIFDLIHLLKHERFGDEELEKIIYALRKECKRDEIGLDKLLPYIGGRAINEKERNQNKMLNFLWGSKLYDKSSELSEEDYKNFTEKEHFPFKKYSDLLKEFQQQLIRCGFTEKILLQ